MLVDNFTMFVISHSSSVLVGLTRNDTTEADKMSSGLESVSALKCIILIESDVVIVSRKIPSLVLGMNASLGGVLHAVVASL